VFISNLAMHIVVPLVKKFFFGGTFEKLPYELWYPFDQNNPKIFSYVVIWQLLCVFMTMASMSGMHLFFYSAVTLVSMQFDIVSKKLIEIKTTPLDERRKKVLELIKLHEVLLGLKKNIEDIFSISIFIHFFIGSIWICFSGFQILLNIGSGNVLKYSNSMIVSLFGVFLTCFFGQKLTNATENVSQAASGAIWDVGEDKDCQFMLLMMIQRSQKPYAISALKLVEVSLKVFTAVSFESLKFLCANEKSFVHRF
jgi:7tm Odorant receptor